MANKYTVMSEEAIRYMCGLIRNVVSLPSEIISNISLADNLTFSNIYIKDLVEQCLIDAKDYADLICGSLIKLTCEKTTVQPTLDNSELNIIYLYSSDENAPFEQYLKISETELIDMGSTSISLNDYLTVTDAVNTYAKKVDLDTLTTEVTNIKSDLTTHTDDTDIHITANERTKWNDATNEEKVKDIIDSEMTTKGVCTTKVADVDKVIMPLTGVTRYYKTSKDCECFYTVKNGICFVCLAVDCVTPQSDVFVGNVPAPPQVFRFSIARADGAMHGYVLTDGKLHLNGGTAGTSYYVTTFSYPVA